MKIFYSIFFMSIAASFSVYSGEFLIISERTKDEVSIDINETINRDEFKENDLYQVYETMMEVDGTPYYSGFVDTIYVKEIRTDKIIFNYVWQEEWKNIKKGYYIISSGMKYTINNEIIRNAFTTEAPKPTAEPTPDYESKTPGSHLESAFIILSGAGVSLTEDFSTLDGGIFETDILLIYTQWIGLRIYYRLYNTGESNIGFSAELAFPVSAIRVSISWGGYSDYKSEDLSMSYGVGLGLFLPVLSAPGRKNFYMELRYRRMTESINYEMINAGHIFYLKAGYRFDIKPLI